MRRRDFLALAGGASAMSLAGCGGLLNSQSTGGSEPVIESRPDAVYLPTHHEGMDMVGIQEQGSYSCALTYSYPHRFWLVTGTRVKKVEIKENDSVHLMPVVWETQSGTVPPDINPQLEISQDSETATDVSPWPMLSQPMGFHFGDNVQLSAEGTYNVDVSIGSPSTRRTGPLSESESDVTFSFDLDFSEETLNEIRYTDVADDREGTRGAVEPMQTADLPTTQVPGTDTLPGMIRGSGTTGDAEFVVTVLDDATPFGGSEQEAYLSVSPRTPHNRYMLPMMSLSGVLTRDNATVFDGSLQSTIDPEMGYHYGISVPDIQSGDELAITVDAPPQTARHEGYETAFVEMPEVRITL